MTLKDQLKNDVVAHMKAGNKTALTTVRNVLGEISTREKSGKTPVELDDAQVTSLLQKEAAKRRDTARIFTEAGETDRAAAEVAEAEIIEAYLPKALTRDEVEAIVDEAIAALKADGQELSMRSIGAVMKPVTAKVAGRFDGKSVSEIVRAAWPKQSAEAAATADATPLYLEAAAPRPEPVQQRNHRRDHQHAAEHCVVRPDDGTGNEQGAENQGRCRSLRRAVQPCQLPFQTRVSHRQRAVLDPGEQPVQALRQTQRQPGGVERLLGHVLDDVATLVAQQLRGIRFHRVPQIEPGIERAGHPRGQ